MEINRLNNSQKIGTNIQGFVQHAWQQMIPEPEWQTNVYHLPLEGSAKPCKGGSDTKSYSS